MMRSSVHAGEQGLTIVELCVVILILGILLVTGIAALMRARLVSNESAAIAALRNINTGQFTYQTACGAGNYATTLIVLGTKASANNAGYISEDLGLSETPSRNGYTFSMGMGRGGAAGPPDCHGNATQTRYYAAARPVQQGQTGVRAFAVNQVGTVFQSTDGVPPDEPFDPPDERAQ